jgi:hypothetical protein
VTRVFLILAVVVRMSGGAPVSAQAAPSAGPSQVDALASNVAALERARAQQVRHRATLLASYDRQVAEVKALKRRRSSWRRDRQLREALARSQTTVRDLKVIDGHVRSYDQALGKRRLALRSAIDRELALVPDPLRRTQLRQLRAATVAKLQPAVRTIILPSESIDPLADMEELLAHSKVLQETAAELEREEQRLERRQRVYVRMARLQSQSRRAEEAGIFEDNHPRRNTSRRSADRSSTDAAGSGGGAGEASGDSAPPTSGDETSSPEPDAPTDSGSDGASDPLTGEDVAAVDPATVLADVLDADTLAGLRRAERSADPAAKAQASKRARSQVRARRERLERALEQVRARIRALRQVQ